MSNYLRIRSAGGTYFFTVNLLERQCRLLVEHTDELRASFRAAHRARPFELLAIIVLPEHLHCVWRLPENDSDDSNRWAQIKSGFSRRLPADEHRLPSRRRHRERGLWQRRFWEHLIRDDDDLRNHLDYVHYNPIKHGHVRRVRDWPHSSFHREVARGRYPIDWAGGPSMSEDA